MIKSQSICPICGHEADTQYFAFPKLPLGSKFEHLNGLVHITCLKLHPNVIEIQTELKNIYLQIFENNHDFPIVASDGYILIKSRPDNELLEVYDFEDFVEFYIPYNQINNILELKREGQLEIGANRWTKIIVKKNGMIAIEYYHSKKNIDIVNLSNLNIDRLHEIVLCARLIASKLGHV